MVSKLSPEFRHAPSPRNRFIPDFLVNEFSTLEPLPVVEMPQQWPDWTPNWLIATVEATVESSQYSPWSTPRDSVISRSGGSVARRRSRRYTSIYEDCIDIPDTTRGSPTYRLSSRQATDRNSGIAESLPSPSSIARPEKKPDASEVDRIGPSLRRPLSPFSTAGSQSQSTQDLAAFLSSLTHSSEHITEVTPTAESHTVTIPSATWPTGITQGRKTGKPQMLRSSALVAKEDAKEDDSQYPTTWVATTITIGICLVSFATAVDNTIISQ